MCIENNVLKIYNVNGNIMEKIKIQVLHTGEVRTSPYLPYGNGCSIIKASDIDYVLLTPHLDCDRANGLRLVKEAKSILVSNDELNMLKKPSLLLKIRFQKKWWSSTKIKGFDYNDSECPFGKEFDLFGDGSVKMINIHGHYGGYGEKSWREMITSGTSMDYG